ncbi:MAG: hypothetical protein ACI90A_001256 [Shewanella sp.]|jgi:hypothetical protein
MINKKLKSTFCQINILLFFFVLIIAPTAVNAHGSIDNFKKNRTSRLSLAPWWLPPGSSNCPSYSMRRQSLAQDQKRVLAMVGGFKTLRNDFDRILLAFFRGYHIPTHQAVSFEGIGVSIAKPSGALGTVRHSGSPTLLIYKPNSALDTTDPVKYDYPMTLVGWAYSSAYKPLKRPVVPGLCIFKNEWFFHEQGVHPFSDWGFYETPPREAWVGASAGSIVQPYGPFGLYHPRFWDIHIFLNRYTGVPSISQIKPNSGITGINPLEGIAFKYPDH